MIKLPGITRSITIRVAASHVQIEGEFDVIPQTIAVGIGPEMGGVQRVRLVRVNLNSVLNSVAIGIGQCWIRSMESNLILVRNAITVRVHPEVSRVGGIGAVVVKLFKITNGISIRVNKVWIRPNASSK